VVRAPDGYPHSLPAVLKKRLTGCSDPDAAGVLDGRALYTLGRAWRTGLPVTKTVLTLGEAVYLAPIGARVIDLLTFANLVPGPGDVVVKNGLVRGTAVSRLEQGLDRGAAGLHLVRGAGDVSFQPCRKCRECDRVCPAGLSVSPAAGREPSEWLAAPDRFRPSLAGCLLCGACALACPSRRPLMGLARLMAP
jgi:electron transport complex protein RnfC